MQTILDKLNKSKQECIVARDTQIEKIKSECDKQLEGYYKFEKILPNLIKALDSVHLLFDSNDFRCKENSVTFHASPTNKFKFIKFAGYTARGNGKNQERLDQKALKLAEAIKKEIGCNVGINPYSLEIEKEGETGIVLIDIHF